MLGRRGERVAAGDVEPDGLAATGQHLLVQQPIALVRRDRLLHQVVASQRGQDPDHGEVGVARFRGGGNRLQLLEQLLLEVAPLGAGQRARRQVQLEVPAAELGLELRGRQLLQDDVAGQRRFEVVTHQVQLDLESGDRLVVRERVAPQHCGQRVEAPVHVGPIPLAVVSTERCSVDLLAHALAVLLCPTAHGGPLPSHTPPLLATAGRMTSLSCDDADTARVTVAAGLLRSTRVGGADTMPSVVTRVPVDDPADPRLTITATSPPRTGAPTAPAAAGW